MQALPVGLPAGRRERWGEGGVGVGPLDSQLEIDRELEKMGGGGGGGQV